MLILVPLPSAPTSNSSSSAFLKTSLVKTIVRRFFDWVKAQIEAYKVKRRIQKYAKFITDTTNNDAADYFASLSYVGCVEGVDKEACREFFNKRNEETC